MKLETLREARKVMGLKQVTKAVKRHSAGQVVIARDADEQLTGPLQELCRAEGVQVVYTESMKELGLACGLKVGAAVAALLK